MATQVGQEAKMCFKIVHREWAPLGARGRPKEAHPKPGFSPWSCQRCNKKHKNTDHEDQQP